MLQWYGALRLHCIAATLLRRGLAGLHCLGEFRLAVRPHRGPMVAIDRTKASLPPKAAEPRGRCGILTEYGMTAVDRSRHSLQGNMEDYVMCQQRVLRPFTLCSLYVSREHTTDNTTDNTTVVQTLK